MPSSQQSQADIGKIEADVQTANAELDGLYGEFGKALPIEIEAWMRNHVKRRIEEHADDIVAGGAEPLRQIKADLAALLRRLPQISDAALGARHRQSRGVRRFGRADT